jgi:electron transfer flavoprotein beta subunit
MEEMAVLKCLVCVKQVIDFTVKVRVKPDGSGVETSQVKMAMNPFDEIAVEEAIRQKEAGVVGEIVAVSIGPARAQETLRVALARGADKALLIETEEILPPISVAKLLEAVVLSEQPDIVLMGKQAIDDDCNQTGQMLAALLGWAQGTFISRLVVNVAEKTATVTREVDGGLETVRLGLPAVITTDLRLNEPRHLALPNVMRAKSKPLQVTSVAEWKISLKKHLEMVRVETPRSERQGIILTDAAELVAKLKSEGVL